MCVCVCVCVETYIMRYLDFLCKRWMNDVHTIFPCIVWQTTGIHYCVFINHAGLVRKSNEFPSVFYPMGPYTDFTPFRVMYDRARLEWRRNY